MRRQTEDGRRNSGGGRARRRGVRRGQRAIGTDGRRRGAGRRQKRRGHPGAARAGGGAAHSSFAASPPTAAFSNHIASMRTGADTRLMPTLVAMGALYDSAVAASESIAVRSWADAISERAESSCYSLRRRNRGGNTQARLGSAACRGAGVQLRVWSAALSAASIASRRVLQLRTRKKIK